MKDLELAQELLNAKKNVVGEIQKVIVGQNEVIEDLLIALFSKGHCLFVGVPGLAKTLLVSTLAKVLNLGFSRIQFTPDLMPSDITGTDILHEDAASGKRSFQFIKGPIFSNIIYFYVSPDYVLFKLLLMNKHLLIYYHLSKHM